jgi:glutamate dehydrogenase (NAD(P)+)
VAKLRQEGVADFLRCASISECAIEDDILGLIGYLAIDSTVNDRFVGGIRILPDVSRSEVTALARNMTLKLGYWNIPYGGAKSCLLVNHAWPREVRDRYLSAFGRILAPLIRSDKYVIGLDMGSDNADLERIYAAAGRPVTVGESRAHIYTAWTMLAAAEVAAEHVGLDLPKCRVAVEGFGKVGKAVAELLFDLGATVVAVSTSEGAIYDPVGLDIPDLLELGQAFGDKLVCRHRAKKITKRDLLCLPLDFLVPCARPYSINLSNVGEIKAKIICPGANVPMSVETEGVLHRNGVLCMPDFLANSGGVLGNHIRSIVDERRIRMIICNHFAKQLRDILLLSRERNVAPGVVARRIALRRFSVAKRRAERSIFQKHFMYGLRLPMGLRRILAPLYLRRLGVARTPDAHGIEHLAR